MSDKKKLSKAQMVTELAELSELDKKSVVRVFEALASVVRSRIAAVPSRTSMRTWRRAHVASSGQSSQRL